MEKPSEKSNSQDIDNFPEISNKKKFSIQTVISIIFICMLALICSVFSMNFVRNSILEVSNDENPTPTEAISPSEEPSVTPLLIIDNNQPIGRKYEEFALLVGGELIKSNSGYDVLPSFTAQVVNAEEQIPFKEAIEENNEIESIYRIRFVYEDGSMENYSASLMYCPENTDICETLTMEKLSESGDLWFNPTITIVKPGLAKIEYLIENEVVKVVNKSSHPVRIGSMNKAMEGESVRFDWELDKGNSEYIEQIISYKKDEDEWQGYALEHDKSVNSITIDPANIRSTLSEVDVKLTVTDGFVVEETIAANAIKVPAAQDIEILIRGDKQGQVMTLGQNMYPDIIYVDPLTGEGCDSQGCNNTDETGIYMVKWTSSKQNLCETDFYNGSLQYKFKVPGIHILKVEVIHKENENIKGEAILEIEVEDGVYTDDNPDCSF